MSERLDGLRIYITYYDQALLEAKKSISCKTHRLASDCSSYWISNVYFNTENQKIEDVYRILSHALNKYYNEKQEYYKKFLFSYSPTSLGSHTSFCKYVQKESMSARGWTGLPFYYGYFETKHTEMPEDVYRVKVQIEETNLF